jgi:hypothetical protein
MAARKRPRRSNSPLDIVRGIRTLKTIYWTKSTPILNGARVLTLTDSTAKMRRPSNAILTYRRGRRADEALITGEQA